MIGLLILLFRYPLQFTSDLLYNKIIAQKNPDLQTVGKNNVNQINWSLYLSNFGFSKTKLKIFSTFSR